jgi:hypothetical protein
MRDGKGFPHPRSTARLSQMKQVDLQHRLCPMEKPPIWWLVARLPDQIECPDPRANPCHTGRDPWWFKRQPRPEKQSETPIRTMLAHLHV